ncbi:hypothetical protein K3495_g12822 [Podosphaera aphanis]|nr:hypothetical protein K3495_g12822 [Podosphaera aphanis]
MFGARVEDACESDPSEGNISDISDNELPGREILQVRGHGRVPAAAPPSSRAMPEPHLPTSHDPSLYARYQCIYPIYFDKRRSRKQGRMVGQELAVENPLAREIMTACGRLGLETLLEPTKCHPKDWANPGRVKVKLRGGRNPNIKNKHHLYIFIAKHLLANPSTTTTASAILVPSIPPPDPSKEYPTPAVPRGWKMGSILPYYSPALSGGGVSENFLSNMMAQMQGAGGMPGMPDMAALQGMLEEPAPRSSSTPPAKKEKKKKGKSAK